MSASTASYDPMRAAREFAMTLSVPVFIVDPEGDLLYYNNPAGDVLGRSFEETGPMPAGVRGRIFIPADEDGNPLMPENLPLMIALRESRPAAESLWIKGIDNRSRHIHVAAFPILDSKEKSLGAMAVFWEVER